jgi:hypothetical protein
MIASEQSLSMIVSSDDVAVIGSIFYFCSLVARVAGPPVIAAAICLVADAAEAEAGGRLPPPIFVCELVAHTLQGHAILKNNNPLASCGEAN